MIQNLVFIKQHQGCFDVNVKIFKSVSLLMLLLSLNALMHVNLHKVMALRLIGFNDLVPLLTTVLFNTEPLKNKNAKQ